MQVRGRDIFEGQDLDVIGLRHGAPAGADDDGDGPAMGGLIGLHEAVDAGSVLHQRQPARPERRLEGRENILALQGTAGLDRHHRLNFRVDSEIDMQHVAEDARQYVMDIGIDEIERDVTLLAAADRSRGRLHHDAVPPDDLRFGLGSLDRCIGGLRLAGRGLVAGDSRARRDDPRLMRDRPEALRVLTA